MLRIPLATRWLSRAVAVTAIVAGGLLAHVPPARSFGLTDSPRGGVWMMPLEHEMITRAALQCQGRDHPVGLSEEECFEPGSLAWLAGRTKGIVGILTGEGIIGAVGAPDAYPGDGLSDDVHCSGGDHLVANDLMAPPFAGFEYPRTAADRLGKWNACRDWIIANADVVVFHGRTLGRLVERRWRFFPDAVDLDRCEPAQPAAYSPLKCKLIHFLGYALHSLQDVYSHSNYDVSDPTRPTSLGNPPGVGQFNVAKPSASLIPFLDTSVESPAALNPGLVTGCLNGGHEPSALLGCKNRVGHVSLNKDGGTIDPDAPNLTRNTSDPLTPRGKIRDRHGRTNFQRAVTLAILETRRQWATIQGQIMRAHPEPSGYGPSIGQVIVCGLNHDKPRRDCLRPGRVIDMSASGYSAIGTNCIGSGHRKEPKSVFGPWFWHVRFGRRFVMDWTVKITRDGLPHHPRVTKLEGDAIDEITPRRRPLFMALMRRLAQEGVYEYLPGGSPLVDEHEDDEHPPASSLGPIAEGPTATVTSRPRNRFGARASSVPNILVPRSVDGDHDGRADQPALRSTMDLGDETGVKVIPFPGAPGCGGGLPD